MLPDRKALQMHIWRAFYFIKRKYITVYILINQSTFQQRINTFIPQLVIRN